MAKGKASLGNRLAPPRFLLFLGTLIAAFGACWLVPGVDNFADAVVIGFDLAALVFLLSLIPLTRDSDATTLRNHADANDANRMLVLIVTTVATVVVMAAIAGELPNASGGDRLAMVKLTGTLLLTWLFANSVYALHYAHLYYSSKPDTGGDCGGIEFPADDSPDYFDFAYFSFTLGMAFQTSDVKITGRSIRRIATLHSFAAFIFNIGVIAFTINALG